MNVEIIRIWEIEMPEAEVQAWDELFQKTADTVIEAEGVQTPVEVELNVVDDTAIREINRMYREIDRATDVLSFPMNEMQPGHPEDVLAEAETDPETGRVPLGNIILSWDHVQAQAAEYGHCLQREAAFLITHSLLHLLGYDHMEPEEERIMIARQKEIMERLGLPRKED